MKAAVYDKPGAPTVLKYVDLPDPECGPGDVLIAVEAISIEGGDLIHRRSCFPPRPSHVVGFAAAGTVVAVGSKVTSRAPGDRVTSFGMTGSHASLRAVCAGHTWLIPDGVSMPDAAALPISFGTAHHCLFARGKLRPGETILIQGASGGVGLAAVQLAKKAGATVVAVTSGAEKKQYLEQSGADHVIDRRQADIRKAVMELTDGNGVELAIDPVGSTLQVSLSTLAPEGRLVFVGNAGGDHLGIELWPALQANQSLLGVFMGTQLALPAISNTVNTMLEAVADRHLEVAIDRTFPLVEAAAAHAHAEMPAHLGRVIMVP